MSKIKLTQTRLSNLPLFTSFLFKKLRFKYTYSLGMSLLVMMTIILTSNNLHAQDYDGDGVPDVTDLDDDNDGILDSLEYLEQEEITNGDFKEFGTGQTISSIPDWTLSSGTVFATANGTVFNANNSTQTLTQSVSGLDNFIGGNAQIIMDLKPQESTPSTDSDPLTFDVSYDGTLYARVKTLDDVSSPATVTYFNGASGNISSMVVDNRIAPQEDYTLWIIDLPIGIATSGTVQLDFNTVIDDDGTTNDDDMRLRTISILSCSHDTDNDGISNYLDLDSDNDGIPDIMEAGGIDTNGDGQIDYPTANDPTSMVDLDGDGLSDTYDDTDTAGSTPSWVAGTTIENPDSDGDGNADGIDLDADNDGIPDLIEAGGVDSNGDGLVDGLEPDGSLTTDLDSDGYTDNFDPDDDGTFGIDSVQAEAQPLVETDGSGNYLNGETGSSLDTDGDGLADQIDLDADNDGIPDLVEAGGIDSDGNGIVDTIVDVDFDGFADVFDTDNNGTAGIDDATLTLLKTGGTDTDGDGKADDVAITFVDGANVSSDTDDDGLVDHLDLDADNDGIPDLIEAGGPSPFSNGMVDVGAPWDTDGDGLTDIYDENNSGTSLVKTTDDDNSDGKLNALDTMLAGGTNVINIDSDGYPNHLDLDSDNDGITDVVENASGSVNADNGGSGALTGTVNAYTDVADTNGWNDASTITTTDSDSDGIADYLDIDADNDGIVDYLEGTCSTCYSFTLDPASNTTDTNGDGVLDIYGGLTDLNANGGSNIGTTPNIDDDAINIVPDYLDTDTDSDGAYDWTEGYDSDNNGVAVNDLILMATNYEAATSNGYYLNASDIDSDGIPNWLDNLPTIFGYNESVRPPFLNPATSYYHDTNADGLVSLLDWNENGTAAPTPDNTVPSSGVDDLDWRDISALISLPVELSAFDVYALDCAVQLKWTTASEEKFNYFIIEWSEDGIDFITRDRVGSTGNNNGGEYSFVDEKPATFNYYRLKMVDNDESFEYSKVVFANVNCEAVNDELNVFPNPINTDQALTVEFFTQKNKAQIIMIDMLGRVAKRFTKNTNEGFNKLQLDISDLPQGTYHIQIEGNEISKTIVIHE